MSLSLIAFCASMVVNIGLLAIIAWLLDELKFERGYKNDEDAI